MKEVKEGYKLSTGKIIEPPKGFLGISKASGEFRISEGYDCIYSLDQEDDFTDLTIPELIEIAKYMQEQWRECEKQLLESNPDRYIPQYAPHDFIELKSDSFKSVGGGKGALVDNRWLIHKVGITVDGITYLVETEIRGGETMRITDCPEEAILRKIDC